MFTDAWLCGSLSSTRSRNMLFDDKYDVHRIMLGCKKMMIGS